MKSTKRITSALLSLLLIISIALSATSCFSLQIPQVGVNNGDTDGDGGSTDNGANNDQGGSQVIPDSATGDSSDSGDDSSDPSDFIAGEQDVSYDKLTPATRGLLAGVRIVSNFERYIGYGQSTLSQYKKEGSGVIYKLDRSAGNAYIITNYHVVYHSDSISTNKISTDIDVYLYGQESAGYKIKAKFVGGSLSGDIAVLKIENSQVIKHSNAIVPRIADSECVRVFDDCFAVGNPEGYGISITEGKINVDLENLSILGADGKTTLNLRVMRVSAAINEGNSGGGLYNSDGELIGIVCAKRTGDDVDNIAYAIPINLAKNVANIIIESEGTLKQNETGYYKYQLGITMSATASGVKIDEATGELIRVEKVEIVDIDESSKVSGELGVGDVITSITVDGKTVTTTRVHHVVDMMLTAREGSTVSISVIRDGISLTKTFTVTSDMRVKAN